MISMFLSAIAACTGWPPNVIPCVYMRPPERNGSITRSLATSAPMAAYADDMPLAHVIRSGVTPKRSAANQWPEPAEAGDHLVEAEQDAVPVAQLAHALEVAGRRHERAARRSAPAR